MITRKNKKNSTWHQAVAWLFVFLLTGSFLFGQNVLAVGDYSKADGSRLDPAEWNGLVTDFVNTWQTASMIGPLGIGTADPAGYKLNVNGNTNITGSLSATTFNGSYLGTLNAANISSGIFGNNIGGGDFSFPGKVGIGTSNPTFPLDVNVGSDDVRFYGNGGGGLGLLLEDTISGGHGWYFNTNPGDGGFGINHAGATGSISLPGVRVLSALPSGNVGIGISDPGAYRLYVNGTSNLAGNTDIGGILNVGGNTSIAGTLNVTGVITGGGLTGVVSAANVSAGTFADSTGGGNFNFPGSVGIGATTPNAILQVNATSSRYTTQTGTFAVSDNANQTKRLIFGFDNTLGTSGAGFISSIYLNNAWLPTLINPNGGGVGIGYSNPGLAALAVNGNVGIGTNNPGRKLEVAGANVRIKINADTATTPGFEFYINNERKWLVYNGSSDQFVWKTNSMDRMSLLQNGDMGLGGAISDTAALTGASMVIKSGGNVGIGTTDPSAAKLVINAGTGMALKAYGDGVFTGTLQTQTGSDFAEEFSTTEDLEPGTVVVMGDGGYKSVRPCGKEYDTTVVGIVSNNPSIIAGRVISKHKAIIAMMGVVKVNVIDINGKISKGDLLTTSGISGYAMKTDGSKPGTIIGKALENLTKKSGEINVLVNLQ